MLNHIYFNKHVEHVSKQPVLSNVHVKPVLVQPVKIVIPPNTFQQHLPEMFSQPKVGEMETDETPT